MNKPIRFDQQERETKIAAHTEHTQQRPDWQTYKPRSTRKRSTNTTHRTTTK